MVLIHYVHTMMCKKSIPIEEILYGFLFIFLSLIFSIKLSSQFSLPKLAALRIIAVPLTILWSYYLIKGRLKKIPASIAYPILATALWWTGTTFFALHKYTALHGLYHTNNGLLTHLYYLLLFWVTATLPLKETGIRRIVKLFIFALIPAALYALIHELRLDPVQWGGGFRFGSTFGNSVIFAAVLGLSLPFVFTFILLSRGFKKIFPIMTFVLFLIAFFSTNARGPWVGAVISFSILLISYIKIKAVKLKTLAFYLIIISFLAIAFSSLNLDLLKNDKKYIFHPMSILSLKESTNRLERIANRFQSVFYINNDKSIEGRFLHYKAAVYMIGDYPLKGVGFDGYRHLFPEYKPLKFNQYYRGDTIPSNVHNGYLQMAVSTGIPGLLFYSIFIVSLFLFLIKRYRNNRADGNTGLLSLAFLSSLSGFLVQDIFGWPDIVLNSFFWILCGLSLSLCIQAPPATGIAKAKRPLRFLFASFITTVLILLAIESTDKVYADRLFHIVRERDVEKEWPRIEDLISKGLKSAPDNYYYEDISARALIKRFHYTKSMEDYRKAMDMVKRACLHNPYNPYILSRAVLLDTNALAYGVRKEPSDFTKEILQDLKRLSPNYQWINKEISLLHREWGYHNFFHLLKEGDAKSALKQIDKITRAYPDNWRYYEHLGKLHIILGDRAKGEDSFLSAFMIRSYKHRRYGNAYRMRQELYYNHIIGYIEKGDFERALIDTRLKFVNQEEYLRALNEVNREYYVSSMSDISFDLMDNIIEKLQKKESHKALEVIDELVLRYSDNGNIDFIKAGFYIIKGKIHMLQKDFEKAEATFKTALKLKTGFDKKILEYNLQ